MSILTCIDMQLYWLLYAVFNIYVKLTWVHIKLVSPKGNQSWIFTGRTDVEAEAPILWPPDANNWLVWKDADAGKDWKQEEKGTTEDETVGWHHWKWAWVWSSSGIWWRIGNADMLQSMGSQRVGHDWATEQRHELICKHMIWMLGHIKTSRVVFFMLYKTEVK